MINTDEDALECDLAETYHIFDYRSLPCERVATFACGLRNTSRIKLKLQDEKYTFEQKLQALAVDRLADLVWSKTKDAAQNRNRPKSIYEQMIARDDIVVFCAASDFDRARANIIGGSNGQQ